MRRIAALLVAATVTAAFAAGTSGAASRPIANAAEAAGSSFPERALVVTTAPGLNLDSSRLNVTENGRPVLDLSIVPATQSQAKEFGAVLVIDSSDSMVGRPIHAAMAAARAFALHRNPNQQFALISFNASPKVLLPFTTDGKAIADALSQTPALAYGTHIYDATTTALQLLSAAGIRSGSIVILSDGADTGSTVLPKAAITAARSAHVRVFTVGLRSGHFNRAALKGLALATNGQYTEAKSSQDLTRIYNALGAQLASQYLIRYRSLAGPGKPVRVSVTVDGKPAASLGYRTPTLVIAHAAPYHRSAAEKLIRSTLTLVLISLLCASLLGLAVLSVLSGPKKGTLLKRMTAFVSIPDPAARKSAVFTDRLLEGTEQLVGGARWWERFQADLDIAKITMPVAQIVVLTIIGMVVALWLLVAVFGTLLVGLLAFLIPVFVRSYVRRRVDRQRRLFGDQLSDNLQVLASALRAGHSFMGALSVVVDDAPEPSRTEFRRVVSDEQLGIPLDESLETVVKRMKSRELEQVALVAALQRESGGNTAEVLDRVSDTIRERAELRRTVRTLTAQGRASRWVVSFLPLALLLAISAVNPGYIHPMFANLAGRIMLAVAALMVVLGSFVIKRIVEIRV